MLLREEFLVVLVYVKIFEKLSYKTIELGHKIEVKIRISCVVLCSEMGLLAVT